MKEVDRQRVGQLGDKGHQSLGAFARHTFQVPERCGGGSGESEERK